MVLLYRGTSDAVCGYFNGRDGPMAYFQKTFPKASRITTKRFTRIIEVNRFYYPKV